MANAGRPEILTEKVARQICRMIHGMSEGTIQVRWDKVIEHAKIRTGHTFTRQMLSQKEWNGRHLIAEAFSEAKEVQKRKQNDSAPKYNTASRAVLQKRLMVIEAKYLASQEELEKVRAQKVDELDAFLNTRCDLSKLLDRRGKQLSGGHDEFPER